MSCEKLQIPRCYSNHLDIVKTEVAIKLLKDTFERKLANNLNLTRVSAPLMVRPETGLNDNLSGVERPVTFDVPAIDYGNGQIVQSLAKWKRLALHRYGFAPGTGLYTDMNAIRRDEELDNIHSLYVDQWDWELVLEKKDRNFSTLKQAVNGILHAMQDTEQALLHAYPGEFSKKVPDEITFLTAQEVADRYPGMTPKQREDAVCREFGAVFLSQIGVTLNDGQPHDGRAPDYDDWTLNGDIIIYYPILDMALELSSMGIRVDEDALLRQLRIRGMEENAKLPFQQALLQHRLPYTVGGGIGQSRICMFFLRKAHVGEVQVGAWSEEDRAACKACGIHLL